MNHLIEIELPTGAKIWLNPLAIDRVSQVSGNDALGWSFKVGNYIIDFPTEQEAEKQRIATCDKINFFLQKLASL